MPKKPASKPPKDDIEIIPLETTTIDLTKKKKKKKKSKTPILTYTLKPPVNRTTDLVTSDVTKDEKMDDICVIDVDDPYGRLPAVPTADFIPLVASTPKPKNQDPFKSTKIPAVPTADFIPLVASTPKPKTKNQPKLPVVKNKGESGKKLYLNPMVQNQRRASSLKKMLMETSNKKAVPSLKSFLSRL